MRIKAIKKIFEEKCLKLFIAMCTCFIALCTRQYFELKLIRGGKRAAENVFAGAQNDWAKIFVRIEITCTLYCKVAADTFDYYLVQIVQLAMESQTHITLQTKHGINKEYVAFGGSLFLSPSLSISLSLCLCVCVFL